MLLKSSMSVSRSNYEICHLATLTTRDVSKMCWSVFYAVLTFFFYRENTDRRPSQGIAGFRFQSNDEGQPCRWLGPHIREEYSSQGTYPSNVFLIRNIKIFLRCVSYS